MLGCGDLGQGHNSSVAPTLKLLDGKAGEDVHVRLLRHPAQPPVAGQCMAAVLVPAFASHTDKSGAPRATCGGGVSYRS